MGFPTNHCDKCGDLTTQPEDDYGEFICVDCADNAAERAWERHCNDYEGPLPLRQQQINAMKLK